MTRTTKHYWTCYLSSTHSALLAMFGTYWGSVVSHDTRTSRLGRPLL